MPVSTAFSLCAPLEATPWHVATTQNTEMVNAVMGHLGYWDADFRSSWLGQQPIFRKSEDWENNNTALEGVRRGGDWQRPQRNHSIGSLPPEE